MKILKSSNGCVLDLSMLDSLSTLSDDSHTVENEYRRIYDPLVRLMREYKNKSEYSEKLDSFWNKYCKER